MAVGEKCWVTGVLVEKDGVLFQLYTDSYDNVRYYASLKIEFPDKKIAPSTGATLQRIGEVLTVVGRDEQAAPQAAAPDAAPAAMPEIAPPPPPTDVPTVTVGQTKVQVIAALGQPVKTAKVGVKEILFYKDMKVTFVNGKVSNVE
jgi:hypothetical protein